MPASRICCSTRAPEATPDWPWYWVRDYRRLDIFDSPDGHWGRHQTGLTIAPSGKVLLSDGRKIKVDGTWRFPCRRDLVVGHGEHRTVYSGIYSFDARYGPTIWLYPDAESALSDRIRAGLASLIGVHRIAPETPVRSNNGRQVLFVLGQQPLECAPARCAGCRKTALVAEHSAVDLIGLRGTMSA